MPTWDYAVTLRSAQAQGQGSSKDRDAQMNGSADMDRARLQRSTRRPLFRGHPHEYPMNTPSEILVPVPDVPQRAWILISILLGNG
jgi:hypothetical protein